MTPATRQWTDFGSQDALRAQLRRGVTAVAAARVAIGVAALVWPALPSRPWVGAGTGTGADAGTGADEGGAGAGSAELASRVFGRALGGRDLALGLGALAALRQPEDESAGAGAAIRADGVGASAPVWVAAGALADALDVATSLAAWRHLPRVTRWLVIGSAAGASLTGAAGAFALRQGRPGRRPDPWPGAA